MIFNKLFIAVLILLLIPIQIYSLPRVFKGADSHFNDSANSLIDENQESGRVLFKTLHDYWMVKNVNGIVELFDDSSIELNIGETGHHEKTLSKDQAFYVLTNYFEKISPLKFELLKLQSPEKIKRSAYAVVSTEYTDLKRNKPSKMELYISLKKIKGRWKITQIKSLK
jgi:hypothetical protein